MAKATTTGAARPIKATAKPAAPKPAASKQVAPRPAAPVAKRTPVPAVQKPSKEDLRLQVEKLERTAATLRGRNRDLKRAAGETDKRIAELEAVVARLEQRVAKQDAAASAAPKPSRSVKKTPERTSRRAATRDPGDAVPPGVAVEEPEPLSEADQKVLDHLNEEHGSSLGEPASNAAGEEQD